MLTSSFHTKQAKQWEQRLKNLKFVLVCGMINDSVDKVHGFLLDPPKGGAALCRPFPKASHRWMCERLLLSVPGTKRWRRLLKRQWPPWPQGLPPAWGLLQPGPWLRADLHKWDKVGCENSLRVSDHGEVTPSAPVCTCVMDFLCDVDPLPVGQTSVHWCSCGWSQRRVECIDVKAQVDRPLFPVWRWESVKFCVI